MGTYPREDLTGRVFGKLAVLRYAGKKYRVDAWECACTCGNTSIVRGFELIGGRRKECDICLKGLYPDDLTGVRIGNQVVIREADKGEYYRRWLCECGCGRRNYVHDHHLRTHTSGSCGKCGYTWPIDGYIEQLVGEKYGLLTVTGNSDRNGERKPTYVKCRCGCGNAIDVIYKNLQAGLITSCGCQPEPETTAAINQKNMSRPTKVSKTGIRGVKQVANGKYEAGFYNAKKYRYLGQYDTVDEAADARRIGFEIMKPGMTNNELLEAVRKRLKYK